MNKKFVFEFLSAFGYYILLSLVFDFFNIPLNALIIIVKVIIILIIRQIVKMLKNNRGRQVSAKIKS